MVPETLRHRCPTRCYGNRTALTADDGIDQQQAEEGAVEHQFGVGEILCAEFDEYAHAAEQNPATSIHSVPTYFRYGSRLRRKNSWKCSIPSSVETGTALLVDAALVQRLAPLMHAQADDVVFHRRLVYRPSAPLHVLALEQHDVFE